MEAILSSLAFFVLIAAQCAAVAAVHAMNNLDETGPGHRTMGLGGALHGAAKRGGNGRLPDIGPVVALAEAKHYEGQH